MFIDVSLINWTLHLREFQNPVYASKGHLVTINNAEISFSFDAVKHLSYFELGPVESCLGICWGFFINFKLIIINWLVAKEMSPYRKLWFSNPHILATQWRRPFRSINPSLKYQNLSLIWLQICRNQKILVCGKDSIPLLPIDDSSIIAFLEQISPRTPLPLFKKTNCTVISGKYVN